MKGDAIPKSISRAGLSVWFSAILLASGSLIASAWTVADYGLTIDEPINLGHGKTMTAWAFDSPGSALSTDAVRKVWERSHEHPPLTRFLVGCGQRLLDSAPSDRLHLVPLGGRLASTVAFAGLVFLAVTFTGRSAGLFAGVVAGLAIALHPRLFAHAHFASPELISAFFIFWASISAWKMFDDEHQRTTVGSLSGVVLAGCILGLALLTKLTGILVPAFVGIAAMIALRTRALPTLVGWGLVGVVVFLAGWPWLWPWDFPGQPPGLAGSIHRVREFLATGRERAAVYVWYFGKQYPSNETPWHFAPVFFAVTTPAVFLGLGLGGLLTGRWAVRAAVCFLGPAVAWLFILLFLLQPIHRYDGERLFLFAFPFWAVLVGLGAEQFWRLARRSGSGKLSAAVAVLIGAAVCSPVVDIVRMHPFQLSYYNRLIGGLPGAVGLGLEANYWGDSLTPRLLNQLASRAEVGDRVVVLPTLFAGHAVYQQSTGTAQKKLQFVPGDRVVPPNQTQAENARWDGEVQWAIVFHRQGYLMDPLPSRVLKDGAVVASEHYEGVWLAQVIRLPAGWRLTSPALP